MRLVDNIKKLFEQKCDQVNKDRGKLNNSFKEEDNISIMSQNDDDLSFTIDLDIKISGKFKSDSFDLKSINKLDNNIDLLNNKIYERLSCLNENKNRIYYYSDIKKELSNIVYSNPNLYKISENDGYYELIDNNDDCYEVIDEINLGEKKIKYGLKLENGELVTYKIKNDDKIYGTFVFENLNGQLIVVKDTLLKDSDRIKIIDDSQSFIKMFNFDSKELIIAFQIDCGIFFYSSKNGFFLLKDVCFSYIMEDQTEFAVKPMYKERNFTYVKEYSTENIIKDNLVYTYVNYFDKESNPYLNDIHFYFTVDGSSASYVMLEFFKSGFNLERINNLFDDDTSFNYRVTLKEENFNMLPFIYYVSEKFMGYLGSSLSNNPAIYSISSKRIIYYALTGETYPSFHNSCDNIERILDIIIQKIKNKYLFKTNLELAQFLYDNYVVDGDIITTNYSELVNYGEKKYGKYMNSIKESDYKNAYNEIKKSLKKDYKWKSEYELFRHVSQLYPDAIFQYHQKWLRHQSLDIFIPSLNIGIEYQGVQHYKSIDYFGGESAFLENRKKDELKKYLCKMNNVKLIYWKYSELISSILIQDKIEKIDDEELTINFDLIDEFENFNPGCVNDNYIIINEDNIDSIMKKFVSLDVETTGLNPRKDRIIEISAVTFENGKPVSNYTSLVRTSFKIVNNAEKINNISEKMLLDAPIEEEVYNEITKYLSDSLNGDVVICAHNAKFDIEFLKCTLIRLGYNAKINYTDTLQLSRKLLKTVKDYKLNTIAEYFDIMNENEHRALSDSMVCGKIFKELLDMQKFIFENRVRAKNIATVKNIDIRRKVNKIKNNKVIPKSVIQYDGNLNYINCFESVSEASKKLNINSKSIRDAASGRQKTAGGFIWKYKNESEKTTNTYQGGRAIFQLNDEFEIIKKYDSISDAVRNTGINSKSIRDAANGIQVHAGGFIWIFEDQYVENLEINK